MTKQYLILIEDLVRQGRSEREIERIVERAVAEDERADWLRADEDVEPEQLRAA